MWDAGSWDKSRLPHGRRGLKLEQVEKEAQETMSPSSRKAGIEIDTPEYDGGTPGSPSSRKAGIEIVRMCFIRLSIEVAFLTEGGD